MIDVNKKPLNRVLFIKDRQNGGFYFRPLKKMKKAIPHFINIHNVIVIFEGQKGLIDLKELREHEM